jgi:hypothetical protein
MIRVMADKRPDIAKKTKRLDAALEKRRTRMEAKYRLDSP